MISPHHRSTYVEDVLVASAAVALAKTVAAPLERAKLILQCQAEAVANGAAPHGTYRGLLDIFQRVRPCLADVGARTRCGVPPLMC